MAVNFVSSSQVVSNGTATATATSISATPTLPVGTAVTNRVFIAAVGNGTHTTPTGWSLVGTSAIGGGTAGASTGTRQVSVFYRDYDGVWTMPAITQAAVAQPSLAVSATTLSKGGAERWNAPTTTTGNDTTAGTSYSAAGASIAIPTGADVLLVTGFPTTTTVTARNLTATGVTFATLTSRVTSAGTTVGNDAAQTVHTADVTTGATAVPTHTMTLGSSVTGGTRFVFQSVSTLPGFATLSDSFDSGLAAFWNGNFGAITATGGRAQIPCNTGYNGLGTSSSYTIAGSQVSARLFPPSPGGGTVSNILMSVNSATDGTRLAFLIDPAGTVVQLASESGYFDPSAVYLGYDSTAHAYGRIRESAGTVYWETSPDGQNATWTVRKSAPTPAWVGTDSQALQFVSHRDAGTDDFAEVDNFNVVPIPAGSGVGSWSFSGTTAGTTIRRGTATGSWSTSGTATGKRTPRASASGAWMFAGAAVGQGAAKGSAAGSFAFTGTAVGKRPARASATGAWTFTGTAAGKRAPKGSATGTWAFIGTASGTRGPAGLAEALTDDFSTQDNTKWTGWSGSIVVNSGDLVITTTTSYPTLMSAAKYNIVGSHFGAEFSSVPTATSGSSATAAILVQSDANNQVVLNVQADGSAACTLKTAGTSDTTYPGRPSGATHYRIRVDSGRTITWEALVSGAWQPLRTGVTLPAGWGNSFDLLIQAGYWNGADTGVTAARFASAGQYNVAPPVNNTNIRFGAITAVESASLQTLVGRNPTISLLYRAWTQPITVSDLNAVRDAGADSFITWEAWDGINTSTTNATYTMANVIAGNFDTTLTNTATLLKNWGGIVYLRPFHEMNGNWYPWCVGVNGNTAQQHKDAWAHIKAIFTSVGATNVKFVWSPNVIMGVNTLGPMYPGDSVVDIIAIDGYNWGTPADLSTTWIDPANLFGSTFTEVRAISTGKPLWIGETGSAEEGGNKATWISALFTWMKQQPDLTAFVWFNLLKERDWRVNSTPAAQTAFTTGLAQLTGGGSAAGTWTFTGSASGKRAPKATATGAWTFVGTAAGKRVPKATGIGAWAFAGAASGRRTPQATAAGSRSFSGTATGQRASRGTGLGSWAFTSGAAGKRTAQATAVGSWLFTGAATGRTVRSGTASGLLTWSGQAIGTAPIVGGKSGSGLGSWAYAGTASGTRASRGTGLGAWAYTGVAASTTIRRGAGSGTWTFTGATTGRADRKGTGLGAWAYTGTATGQTTRRGAASGLLAWTGTAIGTAPIVGGKSGAGLGSWTFVGTAAAARASRGSATGSWNYTGIAAGVSVRRGTGTGLLSWAGVASGVRPVVGAKSGTAVGSWNFIGAATGFVSRRGTASGAVAYTGTAIGVRPTLAPKTGTANGTITWVGSASGRKAPIGTGAGAAAFTGTAVGTTRRSGAAAGAWEFASFATNYRGPARDVAVVFGNPRRKSFTVGSLSREALTVGSPSREALTVGSLSREAFTVGNPRRAALAIGSRE